MGKTESLKPVTIPGCEAKAGAVPVLWFDGALTIPDQNVRHTTLRDLFYDLANRAKDS